MREQQRYDPAPLDMEREDIHLREPFDVDAQISRAGEELIVRFGVRCSLQLTCARCLVEFGTTVTPDGILSYTVSPTDVVDITEDVRQEIMLAYPMVPACKADCKGLCSSCGQNLNTATCSHQATPEAPANKP